MDQTTQSTQISSSQGLEGQNSATKDSKLCDKRVVLGSDKPSEGVATSLRFPSQPGSFSPGNYGSEASGPPEGAPDSPIKTSPVSERIKALEALAAKKSETAKKGEPDNRNDGGGFLHFKERHYEKPHTEPPSEATSVLQRKVVAADQESPESPFEVLGESRPGGEFEDTADWMRAHLPPVPDFDDTEDSSKVALVSEKHSKSREMKAVDIVVPDIPEAFAGVPDAFMDSPIYVAKPKDQFNDPAKQPSVEEESEFDISFLPTAYMWDKQEKSDVQTTLPKLDSGLPPSPAPPAGFDSPPSPAVTESKQKVSETKKTPWGSDLEPPEASEVDSSGESDDTVIEDAAAVPDPSIPAPSSSKDLTPKTVPSSSLPAEEKETQPIKLMQVPTINVIETEEPNYSEEEMDMEEEEEEENESYKVGKDLVKEAPKTPEPQPEVNKSGSSKIPPLESEFMEGYSPPSSPVDSDAEYSPQHKILKSESDTAAKRSSDDGGLQSVPASQGPSSDATLAEAEKSQTPKESDGNEPLSTAKPPRKTEDVDFPDNDDEWSDDAQEELVKSDSAKVTSQDLPRSAAPKMDEKPNINMKQDYMETYAPPSFMQDDMAARYDRQSFDDYDAPPGFDDDVNELKELKNDAVQEPSDETSQIHIDTLLPKKSATKESTGEEITPMEDEEDSIPKPVGGQLSPREFPKDPYSSFQSEAPSNVKELTTDLKANSDIVADGMVNNETCTPQEVMAKSQQDTKVGHHSPDTTSDLESIEPDCSVSTATDSFVEFMRECLKSQQGAETQHLSQGFANKDGAPKSVSIPSKSPPSMVIDLEQERLTINALKELGSSQEEEEDLPSNANDPLASNLGKSQSSFASNPSSPSQHRSTSAYDNSSYSKEVEAIDEWVAEAYHLAEHVLTAILTHLSVKDLVHWRDPKKSGVVFGLSMLLLLSLAAFSVISVASYLLLALLCVTITFRIYKSVVHAVQKSGEGHPFKSLMEKDVSIPPETFRKNVDLSLTYVNTALKKMSRLFLVEDLVDSLKMAVAMWLLTYVGAVFNGITIFILADILLFSVPPVYEKNKTQIDQYIDLVRTQVNTTMAKLQEKLPGSVKRSKTE